MVSVDRPIDGSFATTRVTLLNIVCLSLDQDPALQPRSAKTLPSSASISELDDEDDTSQSLTPTFKPSLTHAGGTEEATPEVDEEDDDFIIMAEKQAKRIVLLTKASFDVDLSMDVVVAEPNVGALARRVMGAKSLSTGG